MYHRAVACLQRHEDSLSFQHVWHVLHIHIMLRVQVSVFGRDRVRICLHKQLQAPNAGMQKYCCTSKAGFVFRKNAVRQRRGLYSGRLLYLKDVFCIQKDCCTSKMAFVFQKVCCTFQTRFVFRKVAVPQRRALYSERLLYLTDGF
jgi:hypothetical protein